MLCVDGWSGHSSGAAFRVQPPPSLLPAQVEAVSYYYRVYIGAIAAIAQQVR